MSPNEDYGVPTDPWVTFHTFVTPHNPLDPPANPEDTAITLLRRHVSAVQASGGGGTILHLPSGVVTVTETCDQVLQAIGDPHTDHD